MERVRSDYRLSAAAVDPLRLTIAYLRLWKACDLILANSDSHSYGDATRLEVTPIDQGQLVCDLKTLEKDSLHWSPDPVELRSDLETIIEMWQSKPKSERALAALNLLRDKFQKAVLKYSGEITLARGASR